MPRLKEHCELLIKSITPEVLADFDKAKSDFRRVAIMYEVAKKVELDLAGIPKKDYDQAYLYKLSGNKLFQKFHYEDALTKYNDALEICPQDEDKDKELYNVILANRSATLFELGKYSAVLEDIELLKMYKTHPHWYKIYTRGAKTCERLGNYKKATEYYQRAIKELKKIYRNKPERRKCVIDLEAALEAIKDKEDVPSFDDSKEPTLNEKNIKYPALSSKVIIQENSGCGRFVVASSDIPAGYIIGVERPFVAVVSTEKLKTNCHYCFKSTYQFLVCPKCTTVHFCSQLCLESAKSFHDVECCVLPTFSEAGVSVNCLMAFRMITQQTLKEIRDYKNSKKTFPDTYETNDISNVYQLVRHDKTRSCAAFAHLSLIAVYLLRMLKRTTFFDQYPIDSTLTEEETYVGSLILKYLQILQYNAHELSELKNIVKNGITTFESCNIGAGLYPTLALFNHSCDPSVTRYNYGNTLILCTIKPIARDDQIYENYGHLFQFETKESRQESLLKFYSFKCNCQACKADWPLLEAIKCVDNDYPFKCRCGGKPKKPDFSNRRNCQRCSPLFGFLRAMLKDYDLSVSQNLIKKSQESLIKQISTILDYYHSLLELPAYEILAMQQKLRTIFLHCGTLHCDYKYPETPL